MPEIYIAYVPPPSQKTVFTYFTRGKKRVRMWEPLNCTVFPRAESLFGCNCMFPRTFFEVRDDVFIIGW